MTRIDPELWLKLEQVGSFGDRLAARLAIPNLTDRLQCALDSNQHRHLLIALTSAEEALDDNQTRGLSVVTRELETHRHEAGRYLDIECQEAAGHAALDVIAGELAAALVKQDRPPHEIVERVLAKWRRFWSEIPKNLLSWEALSGLFAELWFLSYWLAPQVGIQQAFERWRGPFGSRHDFEWRGKSIEVKASSSTRGRIHHINGIEQLLPPDKGALFLFSLSVRQEGGASHTLTALIGQCRDLCESNPDLLNRFENGLARLGYSPAHDDQYEKIFLRVVDQALFAVRDDFPRVTGIQFLEGIPAGVERVHYEINLNTFNHLLVAKSPSELSAFL